LGKRHPRSVFNRAVKASVDTSVLDNCRIIFIGAGAPTDNYVTRAIFQLAGDITPAMPHLNRVIAGSSYNPASKALAFRVWNMPVVVRPDTITINNMGDLEKAHAFLDWLKEKMAEDR